MGTGNILSGAKPTNCLAILSGKDSNIYLGDLAENAIVIKADRSYQRLAQSPELSWVDSLSFGTEGKLNAVVNRPHHPLP